MNYYENTTASSSNIAIQLKDILLADTYTKRGKDALNRIIATFPQIETALKEFYSQFYIDPFFNDSDLCLESAAPDEEDFALSDKRIEGRELSNKKADFETRVSVENQLNPLLFIRGSSGSGKSSYLNHLKETVFLKKAKIIDCNLEYAQVSIQKGKSIFPAENVSLPSNNGIIPSSPWLFLLTILNQSFECIWEIIWITNNSSSEIKKNFESLYGYDYSGKDEDIISLICHIRDNWLDGTCLEQFDEYSRATRTQLFDFFCNYIDINSVSKSIINVLRLSSRMLLCISDWKYYGYYYYTFDSIEHYIDVGKKIFDSDIRIIVDSVYNFIIDEVTYFNNKFNKDSEATFQKRFKFIMCVRDSTNDMFSVAVHSYFETHVRNSIDISRWYNTEDICKQKLEFFINRSILSENHPAIKFFRIITSDTGAERSIMERMEYMYNRNKRRITQMLVNISDTFYEISLRGKDEASTIMSLDEISSIWHMGFNQPKHIYKYLCRRAILRLIWNEISNTGYFKTIGVQPDYELINFEGKLQYRLKSTDINTYARRILIWLSAHSTTNTQEYFGFNSLTRGILDYCDPDVNKGMGISKDKLKDIATVLIALNESRFEKETEDNQLSKPNMWTQLVKIKFNDEKLHGNITFDNLFKKMEEACDSDSDDIANYGVRITDAGIFFTYIQSDFEFFACRYDAKKAPLLLLKSFESVNEILNFVYERAKACAFAVVANEFKMCKGNYRVLSRKGYHYLNPYGTELRYPIRIIDSHIEYITGLLHIVDDYNKSNRQYLNDKSNDEMITLLKNIIEKYEKVKSLLSVDNLKIPLSNNSCITISPPYIPGK